MNIEALNHNTGEVELLPEDQVNQAVASGSHSLRKDQTYAVVMPDGEKRGANESDLRGLLKSGGRLETESEGLQRLKEDYHNTGKAEAEALALGAARGLTLGLSDLALTKSGLMSQEKLRDYEDQSPTASAIGEYGSLLLPTGAGAILAKTGLKIEEKVAQELIKQGVKSTAVQKAIAKGVGSSVEGAFFGAGNVIHESALGREDLTAQNVVANIGLGGLMGGALGSTLGFASETMPRYVKNATNALESITNSVADKMPNLGIKDKLNDVYAAVSSKVSGVDQGLIKKYASPFSIGGKEAAENRAAALLSTEEKILDKPKQLHEKLSKAHKEMEELNHKFYGSVFPEEIKKLTEENIGSHFVFNAYNNVLKEGEALLADMTNNAAEYSPFIRSKFETLINETKENLLTYNKLNKEAGSKAQVEELFRDIREFRQKSQKIISSTLKNNDETINAVNKIKSDFLPKVKELETSQELLKEMGKRASEVNFAESQYLESKKVLEKLLGQEDSVSRFGPSRPSVSISLDKVQRMARSFDSGKQTIYEEAINNYIKNSVNFTQEVVKSLENTPNIKLGTRDVRRLLNVSKEEQGNLSSLLTRAAEGKRLKPNGLAGIPFLFNSIGGGALGYSVAGGGEGTAELTGGLLAFNALANPHNAMKVLAMIERMSSGTKKTMTDSVEAMAKAAGGKSGAVKQGSIKYLTESSFNSSKESNPNKAFNNVVDNIKEHVAQPDKYLDGIAEKLGSSGIHAPKITENIIGTSGAALSFLNSKIPQNPLEGMQGFDKGYGTSKSSMMAFGNYLKYTENPQIFLEEAKEGIITTEGIETMKTVYPALFEEFKTKLLDKLAEDETIPYAKKSAISQALEMAVDPSHNVNIIMTAQGIYSQSKAPVQQVQQTNFNPNKLNLSGSMETDMQRIGGRGK